MCATTTQYPRAPVLPCRRIGERLAWRCIAVRQGRQYLRAELPMILATRGDVLSASMLRVIEDLALNWRGLDERIDRMSEERSKGSPARMPVPNGC